MTTTERVQPSAGTARTSARLLAVAGAVAAAVAVWVIAVPVLGVDLQGPAGPDETAPQPVTFVAVVLTSLIASLAGWGFLAVLERFVARARTVWTVVALGFLLLSFAGPVLGTGVPTSSRISLSLMHVAVAAVLVPLLRRSSPAQ